jgi:1,4-alpha-glucan branching enzyme
MLNVDDIERLVRAEHWDPFVLLGPHPAEVTGRPATVVRAFVPEAQAIALLTEETAISAVPMTCVDPAGLFETCVPTALQKSHYRLRVTDRWGHTVERHDPYAFGPLISDFDLHLFAEGRLYRGYALLGAHRMAVDAVHGVRFVVWAPNARRVSVVG